MLETHPKVKPAAAAASCRSPDEVVIEVRKGRGVQQIVTVSEDQRGTKEHEQYECEVKTG
jgi:hypothetical protein